MIPTNRLRFVERFVNMNTDQKTGISTGHAVKILQQWWEESMTINLGWTGDMPIGQAKGEWRDIPLEEEK